MKQEDRKSLAFWTFFTLEAMMLLALFVACFAIFFYFTWEVFRKQDDMLDSAKVMAATLLALRGKGD